MPRRLTFHMLRVVRCSRYLLLLIALSVLLVAYPPWGRDVVGQLYIAVVVARLIGLQIVARRRDDP